MNMVKLLRITRGQTQWQLAQETLIPNYRLSVLENGKAEPTDEELERLAETLGADSESLTREITEESLMSSA